MSRPAIVFPDIEEWLTGWLRTRLPEGTFVSNRLPRVLTPNRFAVIVRDDSGPDDQFTATRRIGVRFLAPDDAADDGDIARQVAALLRTAATIEPGNPVAAVGSVNGPYRVPAEGNRPERYLTAELIIVGEPFTRKE